VNILVLPHNYPAFDTEVTRSRNGTSNFPVAAAQTPRYSKFAEDLASLHSVAIKSDVRIISAVSQLAKISANDAAAVDVARILGCRTLIPSFGGSKESAREFFIKYNGSGVRRLVRTVAGATISKEEVTELLESILEDALTATFSHLVPDGSNNVILGQDEEFILKTAIAERLPRIFHEEAFSFAGQLILDLKERIGHAGALAIDDGAVFVNSGRLLSIVDVGSLPVRFDAEGRTFRRNEYDLI